MAGKGKSKLRQMIEIGIKDMQARAMPLHRSGKSDRLLGFF